MKVNQINYSNKLNYMYSFKKQDKELIIRDTKNQKLQLYKNKINYCAKVPQQCRLNLIINNLRNFLN